MGWGNGDHARARLCTTQGGPDERCQRGLLRAQRGWLSLGQTMGQRARRESLGHTRAGVLGPMGSGGVHWGDDGQGSPHQVPGDCRQPRRGRCGPSLGPQAETGQ